MKTLQVEKKTIPEAGTLGDISDYLTQFFPLSCLDFRITGVKFRVVMDYGEFDHTDEESRVADPNIDVEGRRNVNLKGDI